jgi:hypothetical protein
MEFAGAAGRENAARAEGKPGADVFLEQLDVNGTVGVKG